MMATKTRNINIRPAQAFPRSFMNVNEGEFAVARPGGRAEAIVTTGLIACKAAVLYHPETRQGLIAHLCLGAEASEQFGNIKRYFGAHLLPATTGHLVTGDYNDTYSGLFYTHAQALELMQGLGLRELLVDENHGQTPHRGVSLDLQSGEVAELHSMMVPPVGAASYPATRSLYYGTRNVL